MGLNVDADTLRHIYAEELKRGAAVLKNRLRNKSR